MFAAALTRVAIINVPPPVVVPNFTNVQLLLRGAGNGVQSTYGNRQNEGTVWNSQTLFVPEDVNYVIWTPYTNLGKFPSAPDDGVRAMSSYTGLLQPTGSSANMNYGPWTIEGWVFINGAASYNTVGTVQTPSADPGSDYLAVVTRFNWETISALTGRVTFTFMAGFNATPEPVAASYSFTISVPTEGAWVHVAMVTSGPYGVSGSKAYMFLNGVLKQQINFFGLNPSIPDGTINTFQSDTTLRIAYRTGTIGGQFSYSGAYRGFTGLRYVRQALSTASFTPPISKVNNTQVGWTTVTPAQTPTTALTGSCRYVSNFIGASSTDNLGVIDVSSYCVSPGNPNSVGIRSSTAVVKYVTASPANSSILFSGTSQWLAVPQSTFFGTGAWTVEFAIRVVAAKAVGIVGLSNSTSNTASWGIELNVSNQFLFRVSNTTILTVSTAPLTLNTWYHVVFARSANTITMYLNGIVPSGGSTTTTLNSVIGVVPAPLYIGCTRPTTSAAVPTTSNFNGYLQDLRITAGVALYTGTFTPPTEPLPSV